MLVLVGCETSGHVRNAFRYLGHDAWSCDFLPADDCSPYHLRMDLREALTLYPWDMLIAHPTCTYMCSSGLHWNYKNVGRVMMTEYSLNFVRFLMALPIKKIVIENPRGCIGTRIRKADQTIQPHQFGHDASKATDLWLKGVDKLTHTRHVPPRIVNYQGKLFKRWANQTDSGQNKLPPSDDRWKIRSETYPGIAEAMAVQWSGADLI